MSSPIDSVPPMELGKFKIKQHEFKLAEQAFLEEIKHHPDNHEAWFYIGFCRKRLYRIDEAVEPFEKALLLNASDPDYVYELALTYRAVKKHDKALATAKKLKFMNQKRFNADQIKQLIDLVSSPPSD